MTGKTAIVTDSNSGITQKMAGEIGVSVVPMPFVIDGETFYEDINLSQKEFYEKLQSSAKISTSQPMVGELLKLWDSLLETHDSLVYIPMSSGLSGSCATAAALAEDYGGRVDRGGQQPADLRSSAPVCPGRPGAGQGGENGG